MWSWWFAIGNEGPPRPSRPADQARDSHLSVGLGEVAEQNEQAHVDAVGVDVLAAAPVDLDPLVLQDALGQTRLGPFETTHERGEPDGPVVARERQRAVGERRASLKREERVPRVPACAELGEP